MRILMLAQCYWPDVGGVESHVRSLSEALVTRGHSVAVATIQNGGLPAFEEVNGVRIHRITISMQRASFLYTTQRQLAPPFPDPEAALGIRRVIECEQPEVVHGHNWLQRSFLPVKAWSKSRFVATLHDYSLVCPKMTLVKDGDLCAGPAPAKCPPCAGEMYGLVKGTVTYAGNAATSRMERANVDMYIAVSRDVAIKNRLRESGVSCRVIPNFLPQVTSHVTSNGTSPADGQHPALKKLPAGDYLLYVGDVRKIKGVEVLLKAYARMDDAPPLVLAGRLTNEVSYSFPPNVIALGLLPADVVARVRERSLITYVPSIWAEAFGIVVIEAMSAGKVVIASSIGAISDIITDGKDGILVQPGCEEALIEATRKVLANPDLRARMGTAARCRANDYQAEAIVPQIEQAYIDVLSV